MSSIWERFGREEAYYPDGITKITDPFWDNTCIDCGYRFLSCTCTCVCPACGSGRAERRLGGVPYEQVAQERGIGGEGRKLSGQIRDNQI